MKEKRIFIDDKELNEKIIELKMLLVEEGIPTTISELLEILPANTPKHDDVLLLKGKVREINVKKLRGVATSAELGIAYAKIRESLVGLIGGLTLDDFDATAKKSKFAKSKKARKGILLHRIPTTMQVDHETKCLVRLAVSEELVVENLEIDEFVVSKAVRVSDEMRVDLIDPSENGDVFKIRTFNESEQFIDEDEYTEWLFYVKPLKAGVHPLLLKLAVIQMVNGKPKYREEILEEVVTIVSEKVDETEEIEFKQANLAFEYAGTSNLAQAHSKTSSINFTLRAPKFLQRIAVMMAALILITSTTWAIAPDEIAWVKVRYFENKEESYTKFVQKYPKSRHRKTAFVQKVKVAPKLENFKELFQEYPETKKLEPVVRELKKIEPILWQSVQKDSVPNLRALADYQLLFEQTPTEHKDELNHIVTKLETKVAQAISSNSNQDFLKEYKELFPKGKHIEDVKKVLKKEKVTPEELEKEVTPEPTKKEMVNMTGQVVDQNNKAISKAKIEYHTPNSILSSAETNAEGKFSLPLPQGQQTGGSAYLLVRATDCSSKQFVLSEFSTLEKVTLVIDCADRIILQPMTHLDSIITQIQSNMVFVKGGQFTMGQPDPDIGGKGVSEDEQPHEVKLSDYKIGKYEVTIEEYMAFVNDGHPEHTPEWLEKDSDYNIETGSDYYKKPGMSLAHKRYAIVGVSWNNATAYAEWLHKKTGKRYRLPTEAEWEYAARGGQKGWKQDHTYAGSNDIDAVAWYEDNSSGRVHRVGDKKLPNELGLHDMSGNVWEWCRDKYKPTYYKDCDDLGVVTDPECTDGSYRVFRGGSWYYNAHYCRVAIRLHNSADYHSYDMGFRLATSL